MIVRFSVTGDVFTQGWVVQHVSITKDVYNEDGSRFELSPFTASYWEAWQVVNGTVQLSGEDTFSTGRYNDAHHGVVSVMGEARFYTNVEVAANSPSTWSTTAIQETGGLPGTTSRPGWWTDSGLLKHELTLRWE